MKSSWKSFFLVVAACVVAVNSDAQVTAQTLAADSAPAEAAVVSGLRSVSIESVLPGVGRPAAGDPLGFGGVPVGRQPIHRMHCGHVMRLLQRGLMLEEFGQPQAHAGAVAFGPFGQAVALEQTLGDLQIVSVNLAADIEPNVGPRILVTFQNNSERTLRRFSITAVAVLGRIDIGSPTVTTRVPQIAPGETMAIEMQLPATSLAMTPDGENLASFDTLVVALDSFDEFLEQDELNNLAILRRSEMIVAAAAPAVEAAPAEATPAEATPATPNATIQQNPALVKPPGSPATPIPGDGSTAPIEKQPEVDLDQLDLGDAEQATTIAPGGGS